MQNALSLFPNLKALPVDALENEHEKRLTASPQTVQLPRTKKKKKRTKNSNIMERHKSSELAHTHGGNISSKFTRTGYPGVTREIERA
jgi:hypothetical protein